MARVLPEREQNASLPWEARAITITSETENHKGRRKISSINDMTQTHDTINSTPDLGQDPHSNPSSNTF